MIRNAFIRLLFIYVYMSQVYIEGINKFQFPSLCPLSSVCVRCQISFKDSNDKSLLHIEYFSCLLLKDSDLKSYKEYSSEI